jgi:UDP-glucose 4-epimerase
MPRLQEVQLQSIERAVVTGGAGFVGSTVTDALVAEGAAVLVIDDLSRGSRQNLSHADGSVDLLVQDVRDGPAVERAVRAFRPDVVFHLAAQIDVRSSITAPAHDASVNVVGSVNVFQAAVSAGVRRVVNTSTGGAIYSPAAPVPTPETAATEPLSAYGLSKRTAEMYAGWFRRTHNLDVLTLRYGNVYGPRQDPRGDAGVIAIFCDRVLGGQPPVIYGDGRQTRDFIYVGDVAAANLAAARIGTTALHTYNVGSGVEVSVCDLAESVSRAAGVDPAGFVPEYAPARGGEVQRSCLDVRAAVGDLALAPPVPLVDGLRSTLEWVRTLQLSTAAET